MVCQLCLSVTPPEITPTITPPEITPTISDYQYHIKPKLSDIIWPSESETTARDWARGKELAIGLPRKTGF